MDTLWENHLDETKTTKVKGELSSGQLDWLKAELPKRTRPFFLAAHHPVKEIENGDWKALNALIAPAMKYVDLPSLVGGAPRAPRNRFTPHFAVFRFRAARGAAPTNTPRINIFPRRIYSGRI